LCSERGTIRPGACKHHGINYEFALQSDCVWVQRKGGTVMTSLGKEYGLQINEMIVFKGYSRELIRGIEIYLFVL
jgi:hypothetical protein